MASGTDPAWGWGFMDRDGGSCRGCLHSDCMAKHTQVPGTFSLGKVHSSCFPLSAILSAGRTLGSWPWVRHWGPNVSEVVLAYTTWGLDTRTACR